MHRSRYASPARYLLSAFAMCLLGSELVGAQDQERAPSGGAVRAVTIEADGARKSVRPFEGTVADALKAAGVGLGEEDECSPAASEPIRPGMSVTVHRVATRVETRTEPIRAATKVLPTRRLRAGITLIEQHPEDGLKELVYQVKQRDGEDVSRELLKARVLKPAKDKVLLVGGNGTRLPSRGGYFSGRRELSMVASGYDPSPRSCGPRATGRTYLGLKARRGIVAVDPRVIPLGARLYVEGYGEALAGDIGSAIKGSRIDLCFNSYREAARYGKKKVRVWILSD